MGQGEAVAVIVSYSRKHALALMEHLDAWRIPNG